jgi:hypothetical protein
MGPEAVLGVMAKDFKARQIILKKVKSFKGDRVGSSEIRLN